jgi:flagellar hook-basal body complex protein FliE
MAINPIGVDQVLAQIRALSAQAGAKPAAIAQPAAAAAGQTAPTNASSFGSLLQRGIESVNALQQNASAQQAAFERGDSRVTLSGVMVEMQKSQVAFRAAVEVRNRAISAYQEIMNMPI